MITPHPPIGTFSPQGAKGLRRYFLSISDGSNELNGYDHFSFFILASQAGYFFDTNIFPLEAVPVVLRESNNSWTGRSGDHSSRHDFYLMYTPSALRQELLQALYAYRPNANAKKYLFDGFDRPLSWPEIASMGIGKKSYKSYLEINNKEAKGLFFWLNDLNFQKMLDYGNINLQIACSNSIALLEKIDFYQVYSDQSSGQLPDLLALPFSSQKAYVNLNIKDKTELYYVDKSKKILPLCRL